MQFLGFNFGSTKKKPLVTDAPATSGYEPIKYTQWFMRPRDLPPFSFSTILAMMLDPTIRLGLAMRSAPLFGCEFSYQKEGSDEWTPGIKANNPLVAAFVLRQFKKIWHDLDALVPAQQWGWAAAEVQLCFTEHRAIEVDRLIPRHSNDTRALVRDGEVCGVRFLRIKHSEKGYFDLPFPKAIFHSYAPDPGCEYGNSVLNGAYSPWGDKWLNGGALDTRRLFMHKDAYGGGDMGYPPGTTNIAGKGAVPNRDIAREIVEQYQAGSVTTRPSQLDPTTGKELWPFTRATVPSNPQHILQYPKDLDTEELRGMEIPDEVFMPSEAGTTGYSGKSIPMQGFYTGLDRWMIRMVGDVDRQVVRPLVAHRFGPGQVYEVTTKPLGKQAMENQGDGKANAGSQPSVFAGGWGRDGDDDGQRGEGGSGGGQQPPRIGQRMSLDPVAAVGEGVLSAAELVKAAKHVIDGRVTRLSTDAHQYSSTQFNLTGDLAFQVRELGYRIAFDDLAEDGREENPHITVKFGLHTNDAEEVRTAMADKSPVAVQFGPASYFASDEYDVVKIDVIGKGLRELNAAIAEALPNTETHPEYTPHVTIAYVKPGLGEKYAATLNDMEGRTAVFDRLTFSDNNRVHTSIPLTAKAIRFSAE